MTARKLLLATKAFCPTCASTIIATFYGRLCPFGHGQIQPTTEDDIINLAAQLPDDADRHDFIDTATRQSRAVQKMLDTQRKNKRR